MLKFVISIFISPIWPALGPVGFKQLFYQQQLKQTHQVDLFCSKKMYTDFFGIMTSATPVNVCFASFLFLENDYHCSDFYYFLDSNPREM